MFKKKTKMLYREPCDCGSHIRHNNGGNYHRIERLHTFTNDDRWCVVVERTSTREDFPQDEYETLILDKQLQEFELELEERIGPSWLDPVEIIATFRRGEAEVVAQS